MWEKAIDYIKLRYPKEHRHVMRLWILTWKRSKPVFIGAFLLLAGPALIVGFFVGKQFTITNIFMPDQKPQPAASPSPTSADAGVFRSTQYKENLSNRLDRISGEMNKTDQGIFLPANQVLAQRFLVRPVAEAKDYLEKLEGIKTAAKGMVASLYDDLLAHEKDHRVEINRILFPREPLDNFSRATDEYYTGILVWMKFSNAVADDRANKELRQLVEASAGSFQRARDQLLKWVDERQDLIRQTRRELLK